MRGITRWAAFWAGIIWLLLTSRRAARRVRDTRRAERQTAEQIAAYVASLTPEEVAEILSGPHWRQP